MQQPIPIGNFDYTQNDKGEWSYKLRPLVKKEKLKETPQYKLNEEIEKQSKNNFRSVLNKTVLESISFIKNKL